MFTPIPTVRWKNSECSIKWWTLSQSRWVSCTGRSTRFRTSGLMVGILNALLLESRDWHVSTFCFRHPCDVLPGVRGQLDERPEVAAVRWTSRRCLDRKHEFGSRRQQKAVPYVGWNHTGMFTSIWTQVHCHYGHRNSTLSKGFLKRSTSSKAQRSLTLPNITFPYLTIARLKLTQPHSI